MLDRLSIKEIMSYFCHMRVCLSGETTQNKKIVIALKPSAAIDVSSALGSLGRRFESCRPEHS